MSDDKVQVRVHWSFWLISALALIWNLLGVMNFFRQMDAAAVADLPEWMRDIIENRPIWATASFAIAVFSGALGCVLLLLRRSTALYVFILSLVTVFVQMIPFLGSLGQFDGAAIVMMLMPVIVGAFLIWYAKYGEKYGWLR